LLVFWEFLYRGKRDADGWDGPAVFRAVLQN